MPLHPPSWRSNRTAFTLNLFRFIAGIGIGVELVTIDTYISELVPKALRGRAFAINQTIQFAVVPVVRSWPICWCRRRHSACPGWRFVVWIGSLSAVIVWFIRREGAGKPALARLPRAACRGGPRRLRPGGTGPRPEHGQSLPPPGPAEIVIPRGSLAEAFRRPYLSRTVMLVIFNVFQTVGFYGFANWVPTLLIKQGITTTSSLLYTFIIALASPVGPLVAALVADKWERKWLIVAAAAVIAVFGLLFSQVTNPIELIVCGVMLTMASNIMSFSFHAYQAELYPTRIRAVAVGFVYSFSRISAVFSAFMIAFFLNEFGTLGVFTSSPAAW